jgi:hypothetical protein
VALASGACSLTFASSSSAATIHYWRFENAPGFLADSVGGATLTAGTGTTQKPIPDGARGASFPIGAAAADMPGTNAGRLQTVLPTALTSSFTVEALIHPDPRPPLFAYGDQIAGTATDISNPALTGWIFQIRLDGFGGSAIGELGISLAQGGTFQFVRSTFVPVVGNDYYIAAAVDIPGSTVTFYAKNLTTGGPLQTHVASHARTALNNVTAFQIGGTPSTFFDFGFDGLVDEVRLSNTPLAPGALLIPEPSSAALLVLGLCALGSHRRRRSR